MRTSQWLVAALLALTPALSAQQPLTARDVVQRIQQNIGVPWTEPTVDTFKDGDPATPVTGIAVTMMATFDVLQRAAARGANLVITHEPTFYDHFDKLDATIRRRLPAPTLRVVGDSGLLVTKIGLSPGAAGFDRHRQLLQQDDVQVLVIGEAREWETVEYVADAVTAGRRKALIILGHVRSEQDGMEEFARWLGGLVKEVPVTFVPTVDPFWAPR